MRTPTIPLAAFSLALLLAVQPAPAQDAPERGPLHSAVYYKVSPANWDAMMEAIADYKAVWTAAGLTGEDGWQAYTSNFHILVSHQAEKMADFDDPNRMMKKYAAKLDTIKLRAATERMADLGLVVLRRVVVEQDPDWRLEPDNAPEVKWAVRHEFRAAPGQIGALDQVLQDYLEVLEAVDFPYLVYGFKPHFGEFAVTVWTGVDDLSAYYGANSAFAMAEKAGQADRHEAAYNAFKDVLSGVDVDVFSYRPDLSYTGPAQTAGSN